MENSNKKIVIKKILSKEFRTETKPDFSEESLDNKIDDKFFEPINEDNIDSILNELKKSGIQYDTIKTRLSEEEIQRAGITLAKRIFELAQPRRETRDSLYLNAFNVVLESYRVSDQYRILQSAHQFFLDEYREYMETRGERPGILSQIIRRVGKENEEKYRHITSGVNLEKVAQNIYDILNDSDKLKRERIKNLLFGNSKNEISAIRSKINIYLIDTVCKKLSDYINSYKQSNKKNEDILFELFADKEEYKKYFYTYASPEEAIYYILIGRDENEIKLIEERYNKFKQKDDAFKTDIDSVFHNNPEILERLTQGNNYEKIADEINDLLYPINERFLGDELKSQGVYHKVKYKVKFNEIFPLKDIKTHQLRELHQREKILAKISFLKGKKAEHLNEVLGQDYNYTLDSNIFPELFSFDPQQIAFNVNNALFLRLEVADIIKILRYYNTNELNQIKKAYLINFDSSLEDDIFDYAIKSLKGKFNDNTKNIYSDIISGILRLDSSFDLIEFLLRENGEFPDWHEEHQIPQNLTQAAYDIAAIINNESLSFDEIEIELTNFLNKFSYSEINNIKQVFYDLLEPRESFIKIITDIFGKDNALKLDYIINGTPNDINEFNILIPHTHLYFENNLKGENYNNIKEKLIEDGKDIDDILELAKKADLYSSFLVRTFYTHLLRSDNIDEFILEAFNMDYKYIKAIELVFNIKYSSLRRLLKEMSNSGILSNEVLASVILILENIPTSITTEMIFNINQKKLRDLLRILSQYPDNQNTFEDIFEIIPLDIEVTSPKLKQLIKDSDGKLTDINECILYIDGFYPKELAKIIRRIVAQNSFDNDNEGDNRNRIINNLKDLFLGVKDNSLIPTDDNWKIELNYIATLYYKALYKENFIATLRKLNIDNNSIIEISYLVYGEEIVSKVLALEEIVSDQVIDEKEIKTLKEIMPLRHKRFLMILRELFNSFTIYGKKLEDYIEENEEIKKIFVVDDD